MENLSRRHIIGMGAAGLALAATRRAKAEINGDYVPPALLARARAALVQHRARVPHADRMAIVDFSKPSREPRFFVIDFTRGRTIAHLVAHGRGSDPGHTGWVSRFSNAPGSFASSAGAYVTGGLYHGAHGRSMRLIGLDPLNNNAEARAIVVHAAWYVTPQIVRQTGMLGRSEGCFALSNTSLDAVLDDLGPGRLLYADKV